MPRDGMKNVVVGMLEVNCYLVQNPGSDTLYIIDPGDDVSRICKAVESFDCKKKVILLTHAHVDHLHGVGELVKKLGITEVYLHPDDLWLYNSDENAILPWIPPADDLPETVWPLNDPDVTAIHAPGHSPGCTAYYFPKLNALFSGDVLFRASIGRTDLPLASPLKMEDSLQNKIMVLPDDVDVFPGHGDFTTIGFERKHNPFLGTR